ncbi:MAG: hypothetical protein EOP04_06475 [Proteobacteria bacterium]|nr:MAG: hypothetical protein EOP04_06475 [Pseudomonadota bacterium]
MNKIVLGFMGAILGCALFAGCEATGAGVTSSITYSVSGSAKTVSVTYQNGEGGSQQESGVALPWSKTFSVKPGDFLYISAQNQGESGDVTTTISADGSTLKTSTSSGGYVIAESNATCCSAEN